VNSIATHTGAPAIPPADDQGESIIVCVPDDRSLWAAIGASWNAMSKIFGNPVEIKPGSIEGECLSCNCRIWIGPRQQKVAAAHALCLVCALPLAVQGDKIVDLVREAADRAAKSASISSCSSE
jgi:hypothetical protein